ncbi:hypothetical protein MMC11_001844 [Xylographa trunciseda]|nr:hypothetical protein [Xylographa trunciseda]
MLSFMLAAVTALIASYTGKSPSFVLAQFARQEVFGVNLDNYSQTYFLGAVSEGPRNGALDFFQLSYQIGTSSSPYIMPADPPLTPSTGSVFGPPFAPSEFYTIVSASIGNSSFGDYVVAPSASIEDFSGVFGPARYSGTKEWRSTTAKVEASAQHIFGEMSLPHSPGPPAYACGPGTGTNLESLITENSTQNEIHMLKGTNFAHMALGTGIVNASLSGTDLAFTGPMEVETSWGPPYPAIYSRFYYGFGTLGPFTYVFWHVAPVEEPTNFATLGYLARDDCIVVNACNTGDQRLTNTTSITPYGVRNQSGVPFALPQGLNVGFTDEKGDAYLVVFNSTAASYGPTPVGSTLSFVGEVIGGEYGGKKYKGTGYVLAYVGIGFIALVFAAGIFAHEIGTAVVGSMRYARTEISRYSKGTCLLDY